MNHKLVTPIAGIFVAAAVLTGCTSEPSLEVITASPESAAPASASPTPEAETDVAAQRGTRANPLAVGESRKISDQSMWVVGAERATEVSDGYIVLPLRVGLDWDAARQQTELTGGDASSIDEQGIDPVSSLFIKFVSVTGRSYSMLDDYSAEIPSPELWEIGTVFPPAESFSANYAVSVPSEEIPGGVWQIENGAGESVYLSQ